MRLITVLACLLVGVASGSALADNSAIPTKPQSDQNDQRQSPYYASPGKPNAGLALGSPTHYQLQAGTVQTVTINISSAANDGILRIAVTARGDGLELLSPSDYQFDLTERPDPAFPVTLMPHQPGRYYLMLSAELLPASGAAYDQPQAQSLGVVVEVTSANGQESAATHLQEEEVREAQRQNDQGHKQSQQVQKSAHESSVISLPAQETISKP